MKEKTLASPSVQFQDIGNRKFQDIGKGLCQDIGKTCWQNRHEGGAEDAEEGDQRNEGEDPGFPISQALPLYTTNSPLF